MKFKVLGVFMLLTILLIGCSSNNSEESKNETGDIKELVNNYSAGAVEGEDTASITATELIVTDKDNKESVYELPEDEFFVSIAPFIDETHPCKDHSLTGCQGEMVDQDIGIQIEDEDGKLIVDETANTGANGFVDFWLPRDQTFQVKISYDGKQVDSNISTYEDDGTCVTTMQLI